MRPKRYLTQVFILIILALPSLGLAHSGQAMKDTLRFGYSLGPFDDMNIKDARIALDMLTQEMAKQVTAEYVPVTKIYKSSAKLISDIAKKKIDMVVISAIDYVQNEQKLAIDPSIVGVTHNEIGEKLDLLVRRDSNIHSLKQLRGRSIAIVQSNQTNRLVYLWAKSIFNSEGIYNPRELNKTLKPLEKPSAAILKVFFGKMVACIVTDAAFRLSAELNPQLGQELIILKQSPLFQTNFFAFQRSMNKNIRQTIFTKALHFDENTKGKQILTLFKVNKLVPFYPKYLDSIRELLNKNKNIR